jgi:hypothetical protein
VRKQKGNRFQAFTTASYPQAGDSPIDFVANNSGTEITITAGNSAAYLVVFYYSSNSDTISESEMEASLIVYETNKETVVSVDWESAAGTVYDGALDLTTGALSVTVRMIKISDVTWIYDNNGRFHSNRTDMKSYSAARTGYVLSSHYLTIDDGRSGSAVPDLSVFTGASGTVYITDSRYDNAEDFVSAMGDAQIVYELANPRTYQLTPQQMATLPGYNGVWADTGAVTVTYRADTKLYIGKKIAEANTATRRMITAVTDKMTAPQNLVAGDLIIVGDSLYKVTANAASGSALTEGTNVTAMTLAEYILSVTA